MIYVDADACPVKAEVYRVAKRYVLPVRLVSNSTMQIPEDPLFTIKVVTGQPDAADDWIVENITDKDIAVTADIPLAARCLKKGARALDPKGRIFTPEAIGDALAQRELMAYLRDMGDITGGPAPYAKRDRSRFLQRLDLLIQTVLKEIK
ncbi:MAG: YaiI/YqxD family protein [Desulfobacteraceae bacterium]|nr:MAG: YaiI/YqxD family protein [Desulfobacteraceae bacterium]